MRIGIDIRCLMESVYSGIGMYTYHLLHEIFTQDRVNEYILFYNSSKKSKVPKFNYPNVEIFEGRVPNKLFNFSVKFFHKPNIDELIGGVDVFFLPNIQFVQVSHTCKLVTTIHDISFERYPQFYTLKARMWQRAVNVRKLARISTKIISVSKNTKNDIMDVYKIPEKNIEVVYSGISKKFFKISDRTLLDEIRKKYNLPEKFILYLGNIEPRKNIESIISIFEKKLIPSDYHLVIAGSSAWKFKHIHEMIQKCFDRVHLIGYVDERLKPSLYSLADIFIYPSFYEGFGFPPLEAMACGVPVITSNTSSMAEVAQDSAILIDPYNSADIVNAIMILNNDKNLRARLVDRGRNRALAFDWRDSAKKTIEIFHKLKNAV